MMIDIAEEMITGKIGQLTVPSRLGVKTSLGPVMALLDRLGHPENAFPTIHIGGTSGKGSTSTFLANILSEAGYKVGLFTKPHLQSVRERFVIDGRPISPEGIMALLDRMPAGLAETPTWFELMTALAFQYFADEKVDYGVIEVGLGGTLDATNVITPELSILTNVGLDHTDVLGDTVEKIASDKVGIFKPGRPVVSGVDQPGVVTIVKDRCARVGAPLKLLNEDYRFTIDCLEPGNSVFNFEMGGQALRGLTIHLSGKHQVLNASAAIAAALALREAGHIIPESSIRVGLAHTRVAGRMEVIQDRPTILLDGAHSPPKMEALASGLRSLFAHKKRIIAVLSFSKGHDAQDSLVSLAPLLDTAILTEFTAETDYGNKRAQDVKEIAAILARMNPNVHIYMKPDPTRAIQDAREMAGADDLICVTGSIFLVGQVREFLTSIHEENHVSHS